MFQRTDQQMISKNDGKRSKTFSDQESKLELQWLNVVPCKDLDLELDDSQPRVFTRLHHRANNCVAHTFNCFRKVEKKVYTVVFALKLFFVTPPWTSVFVSMFLSRKLIFFLFQKNFVDPSTRFFVSTTT